MLLTDFDYALPEELIAQEPLAERDQSRLLVVDRRKQTLEHKKFFDILDYLRDDDLMVFNDTRVVAARLFGQKETGGKVEALLMKRHSARVWEAMVTYL
ncbi:MAG: S-adenosylmethionine:tRNA ribosyltransferase-isomerase [Armatimonadetes bacterium]|nr:S-adenosylmethionine:tRNA ribosyltransferase-isomerase [Armatimonadota bacterium]